MEMVHNVSLFLFFFTLSYSEFLKNGMGTVEKDYYWRRQIGLQKSK